MTELLNKIKESTLSSNSNGLLNKTMTVSSSLATSKTQIPLDVIDEKNQNPIVDEEEIELPEYEKVKVVGRGEFLYFTRNQQNNRTEFRVQVHLVLQFYTSKSRPNLMWYLSKLI